MADDPQRPGDEEKAPKTTDSSEGVRLIKADEAAEVVETGRAVKRRASDEPRYGDRPEPPGGPRPSLRFPLADSEDPSLIVRPRVAAVEPRTADDDTRRSGSDADAGLISLPISGSVELPHWTEPGTGEVPRVIIGMDDPDDDARWAAFSDQGPRWRDQSTDWAEGDDTGVAGLIGDDPEGETYGALDTTERPTEEEFLTFEDLEVPQSALPTAPTRGSYDDPIRISSEPARPPSPPQAPTGGSGRAAAAAGAAAAGSPRRGARRGPGDPPPSGPRHAAEPPPPPGRDIPTAVSVGLALVAVALILFHFGPGWSMILVFAVVALAGAEFFTAARRGGFRPATLLGLTAVAAMPLATYWRGEPAIPLVLFLTIAFGLVWFILGLGPDTTINLGVTLLGTLYVGLLGSFAALILKIPSQGVSILLVAVVAAVFYDVGGFTVGRRFGHRPLTAVSPNKTVEGLAGGLVASVLGVLIFTQILNFGPFSAGQALVFGLITAVAAALGDLAESVLKRDLGIKDMGSLIPGHGGVLDRFDALLFVLPTAYYLARAMHLV
jgi:phosphatidate cytidylyltransferase